MKNFLHKILIATLLTASSLIVLGCAAGYYVITTEVGGKAVAKFLLKQYVPSGIDVAVGRYTGTISNGMLLEDIALTHVPGFAPGNSIQIKSLMIRVPVLTLSNLLLRAELNFDDISIKDIPGFPAGALLRIQRADANVPILKLTDFTVQIYNGRLFLPGCDALVIAGEYAKGKVKGGAYSRSLDVHTIVSSVMEERYLKNLQGFFTDVQLSIEGPVSALRIIGTCFVDRVRFIDINVSQGLGRMDALLAFTANTASLSGNLMMDNGLINARNRDIDLQPSRVTFVGGNLNNPLLDIQGSTYLQKISINISIKGTLSKPVLILNSDPPLSEDVLWMVLAGGKSWMPEMESSSDRNLDLKKQLTSDFKIGLGLEQVPQPNVTSNQQTEYSKKLEGEMSLTERLSVNVGQQILQDQGNSHSTTADPTTGSHREESEIFLKYKNTF